MAQAEYRGIGWEATPQDVRRAEDTQRLSGKGLKALAIRSSDSSSTVIDITDILGLVGIVGGTALLAWALSRVWSGEKSKAKEKPKAEEEPEEGDKGA